MEWGEGNVEVLSDRILNGPILGIHRNTGVQDMNHKTILCGAVLACLATEALAAVGVSRLRAR